MEHRKRLAAQGLSCARYYGHDLPDEWWRPKKFEALRAELPEFLVTLLASMQRIALLVHEELDAQSAAIESAQAQELPTGLGALTAQVLDREVGDWRRFKNRRHIASYTGLCELDGKGLKLTWGGQAGAEAQADYRYDHK